MTTPRLELSDALLREVVAQRAAGSMSSGELVRDVLIAVEAVPQSHSWTGRFGELLRFVPALAAAVLVLVALVGIALVAGRVTTPPPLDIVFVQATYDGLVATDPQIRVVASTGGAPTTLADVPGSDDHGRGRGRGGSGAPAIDRFTAYAGPALEVSPNDSQIAFRLFNDAPGIYLMDRDGANGRRLVELFADVRYGMGIDSGLDWSPNGMKLAYTYPFAARGPGEKYLYIADVASGDAPRRLDGDLNGSRTVSWSPDGSRIAVASQDRGRSLVYLVDAIGTDERRVVAEVDGQVDGIDWSPDGTSLAFVANNRLYVLGGGLREVARWPSGCCAAYDFMETRVQWSPDGTWIAVNRLASDPRSGRSVLVVAAADGSGEHEIGEAGYFDWSPDGTQLVVSNTAEPSVHDSIVVMNADGTGRRVVAHGEFATWALPLDEATP